MGRRSISSTKSGKYINPTDQARKEARKKELKKNKKQRLMVRTTALKNKDPSQILDDLEKIDEMEYNVMQDSPLNDKVLKDKRKKLKETFDRVMRVYHQEEPEHWAELKRREVEYEKKRLKKEQYYESVKHAQSVQIDEIPLPQMSTMPAPGIPQQRVPPPMSLTIPPFSVNKKALEEKAEQKKKDAPGCPPGPPLNLRDLSDLDTDAEDDPPLLRESDVTDNDQSDKESDKSMDSDRSEDSEDSDDENELPPIPGINTTVPSLAPSLPIPPTMAPPMVFRPPPLRPGLPNFGIRMPPGPPIGPRPGSVVPRMNIRMPPGPPAGLPPRMAHHMKNQHKDVNKGLTTITAKPVIRNLSADVTRFVPSTLRIKRDEEGIKKPKGKEAKPSQGDGTRVNKDEAYKSFMQEMQGLL
ncbi:WBP11 family protein [Megaselia abdita]